MPALAQDPTPTPTPTATAEPTPTATAAPAEADVAAAVDRARDWLHADLWFGFGLVVALFFGYGLWRTVMPRA